MFFFPTAAEHRVGQLRLHLLFQKQPPEVFFEKDVFNNSAKFLRTPILQTTSEQCLLSFIKF